jgi:hypothetical protein
MSFTFEELKGKTIELSTADENETVTDVFSIDSEDDYKFLLNLFDRGIVKDWSLS